MRHGWIVLVGCLQLAGCCCSVPRAAVGRPVTALDDGVYQVIPRDDPRLAALTPFRNTASLEKAGLVEVETAPFRDEPRETLVVQRDPIARFAQMSLRGYRFDEANQCQRVIFENNDVIKEFSRGHVGSRVAMVFGGKVVTHHKVRVPLEADVFEISFCTEGGGDHLRKHLEEVYASRAP